MDHLALLMPARKYHRIYRTGWLRAAVLGANDGILSTAGLIAGVAASQASHSAILTAGIAALVAGALSMAAGEYVSVRSQADTEAADLALELRSLQGNSAQELEELTGIYVKRGLSRELAAEVAKQLTRHDALGAHARDELGISAHNRAKPVQAALASACAFSAGAILPLLAALLAPTGQVLGVVSVASVLCLGLLGGVAARAGGASVGLGALRVMVLGGITMALTAAVGAVFGVAV